MRDDYISLEEFDKEFFPEVDFSNVDYGEDE